MKRKIILLACAVLVAALAACAASWRADEPTAQPPVTLTADSTAYVVPSWPMYFDEVTDPTFTGYPEIDHSAVPCPVTEEEIAELAQVMYSEAQVVYWSGTRWGVSYKARQAAVAWVALNRLDSREYGDTLHDVLTAPYQFAYHPDAPVTDEMLELARDVVGRWWREYQGEVNVGRVLPPEYRWFEGDGHENYFRASYDKTGSVWDWSLPDPYAEEG